MAGYRRFIAYVYEYRNGKKENNCGFVKVEVRNGRCTVEIHLQVAGLVPDEECKVFTFLRKEGLLQGIWIGSCQTGKDMIEGTLETEAQNVGGSGVPLEKMGGMIFTTASGGFYGTQWDDQSIRPENFKESTEKREGNRISKSYERSEKEEVESREQERFNIEQVENIKLEPEQKPQGKSEPESRVALRGKSESEPEQESLGKLEREPEREPQGKSEQEPRVESQGKSESESDPEQEIQDELKPESEREQQARSGPEPERELQANAECESNQEKQEPAQEQLKRPETVSDTAQPEEIHIQSAAKSKPNSLSFGQPFCPFTDGDMNQCWKITPQDLVHFPRRQCSLRNNRFLQYGYYNFGHLLLCRRPNGGYILGVPGCYDQQEQFMAGMFGFSCFKESSHIEVKKGRGGYWYRAIDPPIC